jgi:competence protein ComEA
MSKMMVKKTCLFIGMVTFLIVGFCTLCSADESLKGKTVNVNTATANELATVPLVTPDLAAKIVEYREENGDFQMLEELLQIEGFSRDLMNRIKPFLLLEGLGGDECTC